MNSSYFNKAMLHFFSPLLVKSIGKLVLNNGTSGFTSNTGMIPQLKPITLTKLTRPITQHHHQLYLIKGVSPNTNPTYT